VSAPDRDRTGRQPDPTRDEVVARIAAQLAATAVDAHEDTVQVDATQLRQALHAAYSEGWWAGRKGAS
jgi:hypothetical protein